MTATSGDAACMVEYLFVRQWTKSFKYNKMGNTHAVEGRYEQWWDLRYLSPHSRVEMTSEI
jgi:hypothetical protein